MMLIGRSDLGSDLTFSSRSIPHVTQTESRPCSRSDPSPYGHCFTSVATRISRRPHGDELSMLSAGLIVLDDQKPLRPLRYDAEIDRILADSLSLPAFRYPRAILETLLSALDSGERSRNVRFGGDASPSITRHPVHPGMRFRLNRVGGVVRKLDARITVQSDYSLKPSRGPFQENLGDLASFSIASTTCRQARWSRGHRHVRVPTRVEVQRLTPTGTVTAGLWRVWTNSVSGGAAQKGRAERTS